MAFAKASLSDLLVIDSISNPDLYKKIHSLNFVTRKRIRTHSEMADKINAHLDMFLSQLEPYVERGNWELSEHAMISELTEPNKRIETLSVEGLEQPIDIRGILDETFDVVYTRMLRGMTEFLSIPTSFNPPNPAEDDLVWAGYIQQLKIESKLSDQLKGLVDDLCLLEKLAWRTGQIAQWYVNYELVGISPNPYTPQMNLLEMGVIPDWIEEKIPFYYKGPRLKTTMFLQSKKGPKIATMKHGDNRFSSNIVQYTELS